MTVPSTEVRFSRRGFIAAGAAAWVASRAVAQGTDPTRLGIAEAAQAMRRGALSPVVLTEAYLERIARLDGRVNAYITVTDRLAREQAEAAEAELARGVWRGPLHGIPIALKDNMDTAGIRTTAASALFEDRVPDSDAEVYRRLREAGAVLLGKLNLHEFAYGGTTAITHYGPVHNPWNLDYIPGGSSGGSAAAVAARLCAAALGTDTLASIRQPAAFCGVVGFKATHGLASIRGIIPVAESLDHVGPMTRTVADSAHMLQAIAGFDALDPASIRAKLPQYASALNRPTAPMRLGIPRSPYFKDLDDDVAAAADAALEVLGGLTADIRDVEMPPMPDFPVILAEAYAYHERYLSDPANHRLYDAVTLERLLAAGEFSAASYIEARRELEIARHAIRAVFSDVDLVVTPTTPGLPEEIRNARNPAEASGAEPSVRNTFAFNIYGIPTISIPCGFSRKGLPIGLQISGPPLGELSVLALAHAYEQSTEWHHRQASLA
jgi:aspartyl-tRNA(Asn)/glutamyl-tRNA(Gln) amidotransferase subunit A